MSFRYVANCPKEEFMLSFGNVGQDISTGGLGYRVLGRQDLPRFWVKKQLTLPKHPAERISDEPDECRVPRVTAHIGRESRDG